MQQKYLLTFNKANQTYIYQLFNFSKVNLQLYLN